MAWKVPDQPSARRRACRAQGGGDDALGAPLHLGGGPAREGQQQDAAGIGAVDDQVRDAVRQGAGLAGARAGNHQQRARRCWRRSPATPCSTARRCSGFKVSR